MFVPANLFGGGNKQITTMYIIDKTNKGFTRSNNRLYDFQELDRQSRSNPDPNARKLAIKAMEDLRREDKPIKDMRDALIKAHRRGEEGEIKDIHEIVRRKKKYRHE